MVGGESDYFKVGTVKSRRGARSILIISASGGKRSVRYKTRYPAEPVKTMVLVIPEKCSK
jgi:hypothetical protein